MLRTAIAAAIAVPLWAAPASAQTGPLPAEPTVVYLKDHVDIPLAWTDTGARLTAAFDEWTFRSVEALIDLGNYQIIHEDTGQCLTTDTSGGAETVPVALADCADALTWQIVFNDAPTHRDFRFKTPDGYFLGLEDGDDAAEGAEVLAVKPESGASQHHHEWNLAVLGAPVVPEPPSPSESPSAEVSASPAAQSKLPATGAGLGAAIGASAVALTGGAALVLWWQRRRALRSHW